MMFKHFKDEEIIGLDPGLVQQLDHARAFAEIPFIISSGFRTPAHNVLVGGKLHSSHTRGLAVDLECHDSFARFKILQALFHVGFTRIGVKENHIHVDIDTNLGEDVFWLE